MSGFENHTCFSVLSCYSQKNKIALHLHLKAEETEKQTKKHSMSPDSSIQSEQLFSLLTSLLSILLPRSLTVLD